MFRQRKAALFTRSAPRDFRPRASTTSRLRPAAGSWRRSRRAARLPWAATSRRKPGDVRVSPPTKTPMPDDRPRPIVIGRNRTLEKNRENGRKLILLLLQRLIRHLAHRNKKHIDRSGRVFIYIFIPTPQGPPGRRELRFLSIPTPGAPSSAPVFISVLFERPLHVHGTRPRPHDARSRPYLRGFLEL